MICNEASSTVIDMNYDCMVGSDDASDTPAITSIVLKQ